MFANCASQRRNNTVLFTFTGHVLLPSLIGCTDTYRGAQSTAPTWFDIFYQRAQRTYCAPTYIDIPTDDILKDTPYFYFSTLMQMPAPTVRPPSRMAKVTPSSMATGWISSTVISMLSPGITISTPSGSLMAPVTSVVRT